MASRIEPVTPWHASFTRLSRAPSEPPMSSPDRFSGGCLRAERLPFELEGATSEQSVRPGIAKMAVYFSGDWDVHSGF